VLSAVYMIRLYQGSVHNGLARTVASRELGRVELAAIAPIVVAVVALGVYPQLVLHRSDAATTAKLQPARQEVAAIR
jgi:NADH:ubiquinone oxidoreductase subunit 4 (subunit M)